MTQELLLRQDTDDTHYFQNRLLVLGTSVKALIATLNNAWVCTSVTSVTSVQVIIDILGWCAVLPALLSWRCPRTLRRLRGANGADARCLVCFEASWGLIRDL